MSPESVRVSATEALIKKLVDEFMVTNHLVTYSESNGEESVTHSFSLVREDGEALPINFEIFLPENRNKGMEIWYGLPHSFEEKVSLDLLEKAMQGWMEVNLHIKNLNFVLAENRQFRLVRRIHATNPDTKLLGLALWGLIGAIPRVEKKLEQYMGK